MRKAYLRSSIVLFALILAAILTAQVAAAEEGACHLKASYTDVFVIVYDLDLQGNQGSQIWQGRINKGASAKITTRHGRFRYDYNDQPDEDQPLRRGDDRWCNDLNTVQVP